MASGPGIPGGGRLRRCRSWLLVLLAVGAVAAFTGCAGKRIVDGVFHSPKGYRVALPGGPWQVASGTRTDLQLQHAAQPAAMTVNATCEGTAIRAPLDVLVRHLLMGLRDRTVLSTAETSLNGMVTRHAVLDGRLGEAGDPVRIEYYVVRGDRCVYDFLYAGPPGSFETWRPGFQQLVQSFRTE